MAAAAYAVPVNDRADGIATVIAASVKQERRFAATIAARNKMRIIPLRQPRP